MRNLHNIKRAILGPVTLVVVALVAASTAALLYQQRQGLVADFEATLDGIRSVYGQRLQAQARKMEATLAALSRDAQPTQPLEAGPNPLQRRVDSLFQRLRRNDAATQLTVFGTGGELLAHAAADGRQGDKNEALRQAMSTGQPTHTVTTNTDNPLIHWAVVPWRQDGETAGYMALGEKVEGIIHDLHQLFDVEVLVTVERQTNPEAAGGERTLRLPGQVLYATNAEAFARASPNLGIAEIPAEGRQLNLQDRAHRMGSVPLADVNGDTIGRLLVLKDVSAHMAAYNRMATIVSSVSLVLGMVLIAILYWRTTQMQRQLDQSQQGLVGTYSIRQALQKHHIEELEQEQSVLQRTQESLRRHQASLANAQRLACLGNWDWDIGTNTLTWSDEIYRIFGVEPHTFDVTYEAFLEFVHPADRKRVAEAVEQTLRDGTPYAIEHRILRPDGTERVVHERGEVTRDTTGEPLSMSGTVQDITDRKRQEELSARVGRLLDNSTNEFYVFDAESLHFVQANKSAYHNLGYTMEELAGLTPVALMPGFTEIHLQAMLEPLQRGDQERLVFEDTFMRKDGSEYPVEVQLHYSSTETPPAFVAVIQDITERKAYIAELQHMALHDTLTGLPNRASLLDRLEHTTAIAKREQLSLALLLVDLRSLPEINDTLGHPCGDEALQQMGQRLRTTLREADTVARLGSEFALLLPNTDEEGARKVASKIQRLFEHPITLQEIPTALEVHIGATTFPDHGDDAELLLRQADVAMRLAKGNHTEFTFYDPKRDPFSLDRLVLLGELRDAIREGQLSLYYQPKIRVTDGTVLGAEALIRWHHPERGFLPPNEFIPFAERSGLIRPLTRWVIETALSQCKTWHKAGWPLKMAINLSARNLQDPGLPMQIGGLLERTGVKPSWVEFEITESAIMADPDRADKILRRLASLGLELAVDDFGSGYTSLAHLKRLPISQLKIDKSFVMTMTQNKNDLAIVRSVVDLGHNLELQMVAEGVEDTQALDALDSLGCETAQGFYIAKPMPVDQFEAWLAARAYEHRSSEDPDQNASKA